MKTMNKKKWIAAIAMIPVLFLLASYLLTSENIEIIRTVFSADMTGDQAQEHLSGLGIRGQVTIAIMAMLQVVLAFLPAEPVQIVAGLVYEFWIGTLICTIGVVAGNTLIYILYKIYGDRMREYFDDKLDIDFSRAGASNKVTLVIFILYFLPAIPYGMICFLAATMGMKYPRYITVTVLGSIPSVCIGVALGHTALASSWILSVAIFLVLVALLAFVMHKREYFMGKINEYLAKKKEPYSTKTTVESYPWRRLVIPYYIFRLCVLGKMKIKFDRRVEKIEHPSVVLCNHGAFMDFCYAGTLLERESPNFIVNRMYFYKRLVGNILRSVGCFPKSMFTADLESAKNCIRVIKNSGVLAMMPEARLSTVGRFEDIQEGTYAFLKKMGVTVYVIKMRGDYLATPKWGHGIRRGSLVEAEIDLLFTPEELAEMEVCEIERRTLEAMRYDELAWLKTHPEVHYRSRRMAEGLENILTVCPRCGARYSIVTKGRTLRCSACDLETEVTDRYAFRDAVPFDNFAAWYEWQYDVMRREIEANADFSLTSRVELRHGSQDGKTMLTTVGEGTCTLTNEGLTYVGTRYGEEIEKHFPLSQIYRLLFGAGEDFEMYEGREIWYFIPEERRSCVDWYIASAILKQRE